MILELPIYISALFTLTTLATVYFFHMVMLRSMMRAYATRISLIIMLWLAFQAVMSFNLVYLNSALAIPPLFTVIGFLPTIAVMIIVFLTKRGRRFVDALPLKQLTLVSVVRIPVEFVLWLLFINKTIPKIMTFEGYNYDILAGISAPLIVYFVFTAKIWSKKTLLVWNVIGLLLLINIIITAILSFPTAIQQLAFDRPNVGLLYFPFFWLPSFVAPLVLFTHLIGLRQLTKKRG